MLTLQKDLQIEQITYQDQQVIVSVRSTAAASCCPLCTTASEAIHRHYQRTLADLPESGLPVRLLVSVRRFFCRNPHCARRIFAEQLPNFAHPWAQMTNRLREALVEITDTSSAQAGARLAERLGMKCSPSTLLRCQKAAPLPEPESFTKIGLDDFAFRRGRTYGTLVVNLETHRLIDVLPDRTVATVAAWLAAHPAIELISRDRTSDYTTAATTAAPQAQQVCDRWHLIRNLSEYVHTFLARMRPQVRRAKKDRCEPVEQKEIPQEMPSGEVKSCLGQGKRQRRKTALQLAQEARRSQRLDRYHQVLTLYEQGLRSPEIAERVGISARTVRQWLVSGIETRPRRRRPSPLDAYAPYLRRRWEGGEQNGERLYQELRARGYTGSHRALHRYLGRWRSPHSSPSLESVSPQPTPPPGKTKKTLPAPSPLDACNAK